jgi:predicted nucleic acid-binding protein
MRYLLDINVLSEPAKPRPDPHVVSWLEEQSPLDLAISVLTLGEIEKGVRLLPDGKKRDRLVDWLAVELPRQFLGRVLDVDDRAALAWGRLTAEARRAHRELPVIDGLLLATADAHGLIFVTRNDRDCEDRGIPIYNPWNS